MLRTRPEFLSTEEIERIHESSLEIMEKIGVVIPVAEAIEVFRSHGARVDGNRVHLDAAMIDAALKQAPSQFTIRARDPNNDVVIGGQNHVFVPGYGAPFMMEPDGTVRPGTMNDYDNLTRLADALPNMDMCGHMVVEPADIGSSVAYRHMLRSSMIHSTKPFMGSTQGTRGARAAVEMAGILFGDRPAIRERPVMISLINSLSPLSYGSEMVEALMEYARWRQPVVVAALTQAGASGPVTLAGTLTMQNAEILTGITLAQLISPGTPVVYGSTSTAIDMGTGGLAIGSPELSIIVACTAQMARFYGVPSRSGGCLTDAHILDAQAGSESMMAMLTAVESGVHFILHAGGILSGYLTMSYEKLVIDDEICGAIRRFQRGVSVETEDIGLDAISRVGPGGTFLMEEQTLQRCRTEFYLPRVANRKGVSDWQARGKPEIGDTARNRWQKLLQRHIVPVPDATTVAQLNHYVNEAE